MNNPPERLYGRVGDPQDPAHDPDAARDYWALHQPVSKLGVDGWWPDTGEALSAASRMARIRMYYEGAIEGHPNERPYALHRTGYAGMQRYGWLWSGDIRSSWEVLRPQVSVGINVGLSGIPYWGTDIGGGPFEPGSAWETGDQINHFPENYPAPRPLSSIWQELRGLLPSPRSWSAVSARITQYDHVGPERGQLFDRAGQRRGQHGPNIRRV